MTTPLISYWIRVALTVKKIEDGGTTRTYYFVNKAIKGAQYNKYYPTLLSVPSEIGAEAGLILPQPSAGSFTVDNSIGSFGYQRKLSDVLSRYTPIGQTVSIALARTETSDDDPTSAWSTIWSGYVDSYSESISQEGSTLDFVIRPDNDFDRILTRAIDLVAFPDASSDSIGKHMPILIGNAEALGQLVSYDAGIANYAFATTYSGKFPVTPAPASNQGAYIKHSDGRWIYTGDTAVLSPGSGITSQYSLDSVAERAFLIPIYDAVNPISCASYACRFPMMGNGYGGRTSTCRLKISILEIDLQSHVVIREVARGQVDMSNYDTDNNALTDPFYIRCSFDRIAVLDGSKYDYAISFAATGFLPGEAGLCGGSGTSGAEWTRVADGSNAEGTTYVYNASGLTPRAWDLYSLYFDYSAVVESSPDGDGKSISYIPVYADETEGPDQTNVDIDDLEIIYSELGGLLDSSAGTVSGVADSPLVRPDWLIDALQHTWNGTAFVDSGQWDFATYSAYYDTFYASGGFRTRQINGSTEGRSTFGEVIEAVCKDTATRVGLNNAGEYFLYPWGPEYPVAATIPQEDIIPLSWAVSDRTSVINRVTLSYDYRLRDLRVESASAEGEITNFAKSIKWDGDTPGLPSDIIALSDDLYGARDPEQTSARWLASDTSAQTLAEYYIARFKHPRAQAVFLVPMDKYNTLEMFETIRFAHPSFPSFFGATAEAALPAYEDTDTDPTTWQSGYYSYRAQTYRGLIEARMIRLSENQTPTIRLTVTVNLNYPTDPT